MEGELPTKSEAAEFDEFKRQRREAEIALAVKKIVADASRRETDKNALRLICDEAKKRGMGGVIVSPVNVSAARRMLGDSGIWIAAVVGGTGESLPAIKKAEAKKALRQGAQAIRLVPCYSALTGKNYAYLRREVKKIRRTAKNAAVILSLDDHSLGSEEISFGVKAAADGGADGVSVRGEAGLVLAAVQCAAGKLEVCASGVENAAQMEMLLKAGAARVSSFFGGRLAEELYAENISARQKQEGEGSSV